MRDTITDPDFGTHTSECHERGWYLLDWDSDCLRPATVTAPFTEADELAADVHLERTLDASS
jgi:hypothetical protein